MTADSTLLEVAAELYAGPPEEFVATRNARARSAADRALAEQITALRKPTAAAWVVNVFASERATQLGEALQLAAELREAQDDLDAAALAELGRQRRALTTKLASEAAALAKGRGARVTDATLEAVRQTISAAFFDPDAAAAVASGRLVRDLEPAESVDFGSVVGGGAPEAPASAPEPVDELRARREMRKAEKAVHDAEQAHARATRDAQKAEKDARDAAERAERARARIAELEKELAHARVDADSAEEEVATAKERRDGAAERAAETEAAAADAKAALDALRRG
jgi:hypothetical protein